MAVTALAIAAFCAGARLHDARSPQATLKASTSQASALLKLTPEYSPVPIENAKLSDSQDRDLVSIVLRMLKANYVEPISKDKETEMARGAVRGMMESLNDPDSRFLDPSERKLLDDAATGRFHGIGAVLALRKEKLRDLDETKLVIVTPMPGSPAEKAGLRAGDSITYVDGKWIIAHDPFKEAQLEKLARAVRNNELDALTYRKAYEAALNKLKEGISISAALETVTSRSTGEISLRVDRPGEEKPIEVKMRCRNTTVDPVNSRPMENGIAYIRVTQFNKVAPAQFSAELSRAQAGQAKALVLDLRNSPGGLIDSAADIAAKITGGGVIASIEGTKSERRVMREPRSRKLDIPLVVLVNEGTASVSELVAGTLRESGGAFVIGVKTFGDGLVQTPLLLKDGSAAIATTGKMLTAKGYDFDGKGIAPDKEVRQGDSEDDPQLQEAMKVLLAKTRKA